MFNLIALGGLALQSDENLPLSANQRRRLALLVLLAPAGERGITREKLFGYLWPDSSQEKARHALEQLLYATRRDLGREAILSVSGVLRLNPAIVQADVLQFTAALEQGNLEEAIRLYAGPFLDGVYLEDAPEFERWVESKRAYLEQRYTTALEKLADAATASGDQRAAVEFWRRLADTDPLNSHYATGLIRALASRGDTAAALREARRYEELVRQELESDPDPSFVALVESIRQTPAAIPREAGKPGVGRVAPAGQRSAARRSPHVRKPSRSRGAVSPPGWQFSRRALYVTLAVITWASAFALATGLARSGEQDRDIPAAPGAGTADPVAHELYLRGRTEWNRRSRDGLEQAVVLFRQATEQDPTYADAFAGLADAYVILGYLGFAPGDASFPKGRAAAQRALELDAGQGNAYAALGKALQWELRWSEAEEALRRAVTYAPDYATGHQWYALLLTILGRTEEAVTHARHAAQLDPLSIQVQNTYGITYYHARGVDSALDVFTRLVTFEPDTAWVRQNPWVLSNFGKVAAAAGRHEDAVRLLERAVQEVPHHPRPLYDLAVAHIRAGDRERADATFTRADSVHPHYPLYRGLLHAWLGDLDAAFAWLSMIEEWGPVTVLTLVGDPWPDTLPADPRYAALRQRLDLPG
jgi:DNA-binding SARP family transcriptional activator/Tfp pilus assembly protein PilF